MTNFSHFLSTGAGIVSESVEWKELAESKEFIRSEDLCGFFISLLLLDGLRLGVNNSSLLEEGGV